MKALSLVSVVVFGCFVGCVTQDNGTDDEQLSSQTFELNAPSLNWNCKAGYVFEVVVFKLELLNFETGESVTRLAPQTNSVSTAPIMVLCNGSGGLSGATLSWVGPKMKVSTGVYELRVTPQDFPVLGPPGPIDVADPASAFCSVPAGLPVPGSTSLLPGCGTMFQLTLNVKATI